MSWGSLPDDVLGVILTSLSLIELARLSTTCRTFQAVYRRQLAQEHEARCGLAVNGFGLERIAWITAIIIQLLKGEPPDPAFDDSGYGWVVCSSSYYGSWVIIHPHWRLPGDETPLEENFPTWSGLEVYVPQDCKSVKMYVCPVDDEDVAMVALVQAILSQGLAHFIHEAGKWAEINISQGWQVPGSLDMFSRVGLKPQVGPLMLFASRCISKAPRDMDLLVRRSLYLRHRLQIGQVESAASEETE